MSSTPPAATNPFPAASSAAPALGPAAPVETAPSAIIAEGPTIARIIGFLGLFLTVLGVVVVVTTRAIGPRWVPEGVGFLSAGLGLALMLYHAISDSEQEVRRMYGMLAGGLLVFAVAFSLVPGPFDAPSDKRTVGYYLLPWGFGAGLVSLLFAIPFTRYETHEKFRHGALTALLIIGGALAVGPLVAGIANPDFLAGTGLALALLGLGFLSAYLNQTDTSEGFGYAVAVMLGVVGALALFYAFGRTVFPTVLYDGPSELRNPNQALDKWKVLGRVLVILAGLGAAAYAAIGRLPLLVRLGLAGAGVVTAGVFITASFTAPVAVPPQPFLVPGGLILGSLGLLYLAISVGICSESQFVTLTRRELSAYFFSPIGYFVLGGMLAAQWFGYLTFFETLVLAGRQGQMLPEPIIPRYFYNLVPVMCVVLQVPALTMRLMAEEWRTGSLEVLLTSPVSEAPVILSKFLATWIFFLICWLPAGLFLIAIRMEAGQPFDYRPLLSFYFALAVCGATFVAIGLFFSTITSSQIVAAVLTFAVMLFLMFCHFLKDMNVGFGVLSKQFFTRLSYIDLWLESSKGQLPIREILVWASAAVFMLFLSVKVLETRKWK
jgi:ABC-type transport system involved in multi-copper enzyme maturation permease subunit